MLILTRFILLPLPSLLTISLFSVCESLSLLEISSFVPFFKVFFFIAISFIYGGVPIYAV